MARSSPDSPTEWWILLGALALYALARWFFAWRQAQLEGRRRPGRAALDELGEDDDHEMTPMRAGAGGYDSWQQFIGFLVAGVVIAMIAGFTEGALRVALLWFVSPLLVIALAYMDFRQSRKARAKKTRSRA
ncbi:hypothetical protein AB0I66_02200 [Streptomyces sp. NPDC050439]|uniref:hypothetical protein n=1 Tax=unclassified Streptomyces TaxID=2593676 RepID=UPI0034271A9C